MRQCRRRFPFGTGISLLLLLGCGACSEAPPPTGQARADAETRSACEQRAEAVYDQQNRGDIYRPSPAVNTPFSTNYVPGMPDRGLSAVFEHDRMVSDCVRNTGTQPLTPAAAPQRPPAPPR